MIDSILVAVRVSDSPLFIDHETCLTTYTWTKGLIVLSRTLWLCSACVLDTEMVITVKIRRGTLVDVCLFGKDSISFTTCQHTIQNSYNTVVLLSQAVSTSFTRFPCCIYHQRSGILLHQRESRHETAEPRLCSCF
jgi:hypothetical protein